MSASEDTKVPSTTFSADDDSFVVMEVDQTPTLNLKTVPRHDSIGTQSAAATTQICTTVAARELPDDEDDSRRAPVDIVVALDRSGSMHGKKLELCKQTLELLLRELRPQDRFGLVSFSDEAEIDVPVRKLTESNRQLALQKIKRIGVRGCTNISGGIGLAAQEIRAVESPNEVRTIFLLTDGQANRGITSLDGMVDLTKGCLNINQATSEAPISIHTFGYGADHDRDVLRGIAGATAGGTYYFVDSDSNVVTAFGDALGGILSVVAQNVTVRISVPMQAAELGARIVKVYHDNQKKHDDGSFTVTLGDFYAEESRDIIVEVTLASGEGLIPYEESPVPHASVVLSYTDTIQKKLISNVSAPTCSIARPPIAGVSPPNRYVAIQWLRIQATAAMAQAKELSGSGDLAGARAMINSHLAQLRSDAEQVEATGDPLIAQMMTDLNDILAGLADRDSYEAYGGHYMSSRLQTHTMQRCADTTFAFANVYRGSKKKKMQMKWSGK